MSRYRTLSKANQYYLPKHTYLTCIHYALQYRDWNALLNTERDTRGAIRYDKDRIMTTPMNYQEQALIDAADLEAQAEKLITEGDVLRMELIKLIYKLDDISDQTVLIRYYFNNETLRSMAEETNHDPTTYWYRKENAIQKITEIA